MPPPKGHTPNRRETRPTAHTPNKMVVDPAHRLWQIVRGPFHRIYCQSPTRHQWERFDYDRAGCLKCGALHRCAKTSVENTCALETMDDGSMCCTVTGFCVPIVRYCPTEFVDTCHEVDRGEDTLAQEHTRRRENLMHVVHTTVTEFLNGTQSRNMRAHLVKNACDRITRATTRACAHKWMKTPGHATCVQTALAHAILEIDQESELRTLPSRELTDVCVEKVTECLVQLDLQGASVMRIETLSVGILYLLLHGIRCGATQWLEGIPALRPVLPPVSMLQKWYGLSSKLIIDTENWVKMALRRKYEIL